MLFHVELKKGERKMTKTLTVSIKKTDIHGVIDQEHQHIVRREIDSKGDKRKELVWNVIQEDGNSPNFGLVRCCKSIIDEGVGERVLLDVLMTTDQCRELIENSFETAKFGDLKQKIEVEIDLIKKRIETVRCMKYWDTVR